MMQVSKSGKTLNINGNTISFEQRVNEFVELADRVIVELYVDDFEVGDPLVGRNILAFDENGEMLWRIPATGVTRRSVLGGETPEAFFGLWLGDDGKVKTGTPNGFDWDIDPDTGKISNPIFTR